MANKSNTPNQIISIPQGGGALKGIGETFSPDLHTETGNFTVPISLQNFYTLPLPPPNQLVDLMPHIGE